MREVSERGIQEALPASAGEAVPQVSVSAAEGQAQHMGSGNCLRDCLKQLHL